MKKALILTIGITLCGSAFAAPVTFTTQQDRQKREVQVTRTNDYYVVSVARSRSITGSLQACYKPTEIHGVGAVIGMQEVNLTERRDQLNVGKLD